MNLNVTLKQGLNDSQIMKKINKKKDSFFLDEVNESFGKMSKTRKIFNQYKKKDQTQRKIV